MALMLKTRYTKNKDTKKYTKKESKGDKNESNKKSIFYRSVSNN